MYYWVYGMDDSGVPRLLGPFTDMSSAQEQSGDLNGVRIVQAPDRQTAVGRAMRQPARPTFTEDEPARPTEDKPAEDDINLYF